MLKGVLTIHEQMVPLGNNGLMQFGNFRFLNSLLPETFFSLHFQM